MLGGMAMTPLDRVLAYLQSRQETAVHELMGFLRIPTISTDAAHQQDMRTGAAWLCDRLARAGFDAARIEETPGGHPVVRACYRNRTAAPPRRRVVVYGHYDVQPVDPIGAWHYPPFSPQIVDGALYARGAADDKGQLYLQLLAAEAWLQATGDIPVDMEFLFEGEEEIGSPHLPAYLEAHVDDLQADAAVISDTPMYADDLPAICYGLRGLAALEVTVRGPQQDLHSGVYGGVVMNPAVVLAKLLGSLHDDQGRIRVPGFYDDVVPPDPFDWEVIANLPFSEGALKESLGVSKLSGEAGYSTLERMWLRPTLDINGIISGYTGPGEKTIIPAEASAKLSCRLVPNQDPRDIQRKIADYLQAQAPSGVTVSVQVSAGLAHSVSVPLSDPIMVAARRAVHDTFGVEPIFMRRGSSMAIIAQFQTLLRQTPLLMGFTGPHDNIHAPNEHFKLTDFHRGARTIAHLWHYYGQMVATP